MPAEGSRKFSFELSVALQLLRFLGYIKFGQKLLLDDSKAQFCEILKE